MKIKEIAALEAEQIKKDIPDFKVGDTLNIYLRIVEGVKGEGKEEKERIQVFTGTVIARKGSGISETMSLYRTSYGSGVERVFMLHSPKIAKIEVVKKGKVRKGKLYYLRGIFGKKAKIQEMIGPSATDTKASAEETSPETASVK